MRRRRHLRALSLGQVLALAEQLERSRAGELGGVIDMVEVRPGEYAPRELTSAAARRVADHFTSVQERIAACLRS